MKCKLRCGLVLASLLLVRSVAGQAPDDAPVCPVVELACVNALHAQAISNNAELKVLDKAIKLQNAKLWTVYLSANALNPVSLVLQVARNVAGGGERAQAKLTIAQLQLRRAALVAALRAAIVVELTALDDARRAEERAAHALATHTVRLQLLEITYAAGDGDTATMLRLWQQTDELRAAVTTAKRQQAAAWARLREVVGAR